MHTTSPSLLWRVRDRSDQDAWLRFVRLYSPLLYYWSRKAGLQPDDAADLVQEVLLLLLHKLPEFNYRPGSSFRAWLRTVTLNKWRDRCKVRTEANQLAHASDAEPVVPDPLGLLEEREYQQHLVGRALELMQKDFQPATWKACWELAVNGRPAAEIAAELGMTAGAVYAAKLRVLNRLRQELEGLLD